MSWALFRQGLLRIVPVARQLVLEQIGESVLVLDPEGLVVDHNRAARSFARRLPGGPDELIGTDVRRFLGPDLPPHPEAGGRVRLPLPDGMVVLDYQLTELRDRSGRLLGRVVVARDVSEQVRQARELEEANGQLRSQLAEIERLRAELAEQAVRDELTGLHNRRHLLGRWPEVLDRCRRTGRELTVLVIDADRFKRINDRYGHPTGDAVLVALADRLRRRMRPSDLLARYGGEEFVAVLPGLGGETARDRAEELRRTCSGSPVDGPSGPIGVSVSIGLACFPRDGITPDQLLDAADQALLAAKEGGRDRVVGALAPPRAQPAD